MTINILFKNGSSITVPGVETVETKYDTSCKLTNFHMTPGYIKYIDLREVMCVHIVPDASDWTVAKTKAF